MTTYLNLGFACHAKGSAAALTKAFWVPTHALPRCQQPLAFPPDSPCLAPATLGVRFTTRKQPPATCPKSLQGATSSLHSPFFLSFSSKSRRGPGLGQILGELPPRMQNPASASTLHRTLRVDSQKGAGSAPLASRHLKIHPNKTSL